MMRLIRSRERPPTTMVQPGDELRLLLAPPAQVDLPVPSPAAAGALRPQAADADRRPAAALAGAAGTEPADAVRVARARPPLPAAQGGGDPGAAPGKLHSLRSPQLSDEFAPESENLAAVIYHRHCLWPQVRETMERFASNEHRGEKQEDVARPLHARLLPWKARTLPTARSRRNKRALHNSRRRIGRRCAFRGPIGRRPTGRPVLFRGPLGRLRAGRSYAHPAMESVRRQEVAGTLYQE